MRRLALLRLAGLALAVGGAFAVLLLVGRPSAQGVRDWVDGAGAAAPLAFIVVSATLTCALFPGPLLAGASGLLFGTALGFPLSLTAAVLGACLAFSISRAVGAGPVEQLAGPRVLAARALVSRRGFVSVLYARIAPGMPYSIVNYAAGLTAIPLGTFAAATALGAAPRAFAYTALGGSLGNLRSPEAFVAVAVLVAMAVGGLLLVGRDVRASRASLDLLDLEQRGRARAPGGQPGGDADALAGLDPAQLDDPPGGGGDQLLGGLVAAHRGGLHAPHQPAAADGLAARARARRMGTVGRWAEISRAERPDSVGHTSAASPSSCAARQAV